MFRKSKIQWSQNGNLCSESEVMVLNFAVIDCMHSNVGTKQILKWDRILSTSALIATDSDISKTITINCKKTAEHSDWKKCRLKACFLKPIGKLSAVKHAEWSWQKERPAKKLWSLVPLRDIETKIALRRKNGSILFRPPPA